jgi:hypothetical protein
MSEKKESLELSIALRDVKEKEEIPIFSLYSIRGGLPAKKLAVVKDGILKIDEDWKKVEKVVALGPDIDDLKKLHPECLLKVPLEELLERVCSAREMEIPRDIWQQWIFRRFGISGEVKKCIWSLLSVLPKVQVEMARRRPPLHRSVCMAICNGVVEVYERTCCGPIGSIRICDVIPEICRRVRFLEDICRRIPEICNPIWEEDPLDWLNWPIDPQVSEEMRLSCTLVDKAEKNAISPRLLKDIKAIRELDEGEAEKYISERPHLHALVGKLCRTRKVGETVLANGTFTFEYFRPSPAASCTITYAFKVRQWQDGRWVCIYDGLTSHEYFSASESIHLMAGAQARICPDPTPPIEYDEPFVMLQKIGATDSYKLASPPQEAPSGINVQLPANGGLCNAPHNQPWAKTLQFRLCIDNRLVADENDGPNSEKAFYYRISVFPADSNGNPKSGAEPCYLSENVSWRKLVLIDGKRYGVSSKRLGPNVVTDPQGKTIECLYEIPDPKETWLDYYHNSWNTTLHPNGRYLIKVEIFDRQGVRLIPVGSGGTGRPVPFVFLHWSNSINVTAVLQESLFHVFWIDNQPCYGQISDLRLNGVQGYSECQFRSGVNTDRFSIGFRAFHPNGPSNETFMSSYVIDHNRGLNGPYKTLEIGYTNMPASLNVGAPQQSAEAGIGGMLNGVPSVSEITGCTTNGTPLFEDVRKCTFAVNLHVYAKHTDGSSRILEYDVHRQASFALESKP